MSEHDNHFGRMLAETVDFSFLAEELGRDANESLSLGLEAGAVMPSAGQPVDHLRHAIAEAIGDITSHARWDLFQRFLEHGPTDVEETDSNPERLTQAETANVISFIWGHTVNSFQGAITELLAVKPCVRILKRLQQEGRLDQETRLYVGDVVMASRLRGFRFAKGADVHMLAVRDESAGCPSVTVLGVGEVKSYFCRERVLQGQLAKHVARARRGLRISGKDYSKDAIRARYESQGEVIRIVVLPSDWPLPRGFGWRQEGETRVLEVVPGSPPTATDKITAVSETEWRVELRWSREALAAAAYEMTFWFMAQIGEVIYRGGVPSEWSEMTPAEAGYNAAKEKLYYAIRPYAVKAEESKRPGAPKLTRKEVLEMQRAIALYNSYGFGYALGMNFKNRARKREMLWPQDLDEILESGETTTGCRIM